MYGPGMHEFIVNELELGTRVASFIDDEDCWDGMGWFLSADYEQYCLEEDMPYGRVS